MKFNVTVQYPYTQYFETTWTVEASDSEAAKLAAIEGECDGTFDWDTSYGVGNGEAGPTEIVEVEPVAQPNRYTTEGGDRDERLRTTD